LLGFICPNNEKHILTPFEACLIYKEKILYECVLENLLMRNEKIVNLENCQLIDLFGNFIIGFIMHPINVIEKINLSIFFRVNIIKENNYLTNEFGEKLALFMSSNENIIQIKLSILT